MKIWKEKHWNWKTDDLEEEIRNSESMQKHLKAVGLFYGDGVEKDVVKAIELFRENAINGFVPSMNSMTTICHDDVAGIETQDRLQEEFWYKQTYRYLTGGNIRAHAENMIFGSYDCRFTEEEINKMYELAAALGDESSKKKLARHFARKKDPESLKKSLFWFYSIEKLSGEMRKELEEVERNLGIQRQV